MSIIEALRMAKSYDLIQGTLDMLVLKMLARGLVHGWGIATLGGSAKFYSLTRKANWA